MYHDTAKCHNTIHLEGVNEQNIHAVINNSSVQYEQPMAVQVIVFFQGTTNCIIFCIKMVALLIGDVRFTLSA